MTERAGPEPTNAEAWDEDRFFEAIAELVMLHSPSGVEGEVNRYLLDRFEALGVEHWQDQADNIVVRLAGSGKGEKGKRGAGRKRWRLPGTRMRLAGLSNE